VQLAFQFVQVLVGPRLRHVEIEPAFGETLWQDTEKSGARGGEVSGLGFADRGSDGAVGRQIHVERFACFPVRGDLEDGRSAQASVREEHVLAKRLTIDRDKDGGGDASQIAIEVLHFFGEDERDESGACFDNLYAELTRQFVALPGRADFGNGEAACCDDQDWRAKRRGVASRGELGRVLNLLDFGVQKDLDAGRVAFAFEHVGDVFGRTIAKELAKRFLVIWDAMLFDQRDEVRRSVAGERGFCEVLICAEEILRAAVDVREIAAAAAGDEDFLANATGTLEDGDAAAAFAGFGGAEKSCGTSPENQCVKLLCQMNLPLGRESRPQTVPAFVPQGKLRAGEDRENCL
jgi:hypothetical protein